MIQKSDSQIVAPVLIQTLKSSSWSSKSAKSVLAVATVLKSRLSTDCKEKSGRACTLQRDLSSAVESTTSSQRAAEEKERLALEQKQKMETELAIQKAAEEKARGEEREKLAEEEKYRESPQGRACAAVDQIKIADKILSQERKVAAASGYVNKATIHEMGTMKVLGQSELEAMKKQIKKETGRSFDPTTCRDLQK